MASLPSECDTLSQSWPMRMAASRAEDLDNGWAKANGNMTDVDRVLSAHYPAPNGDNSWFGHPARLTVNGEDHDWTDDSK